MSTPDLESASGGMTNFEETSIETLASNLDALTLQELHEGPKLEAGSALAGPAISYPDFPRRPTDDGSISYVLGWSMDDATSERLMKVAGYEVKQLRSKFEYFEASTAARVYASRKVNYFHMWSVHVPHDCETATGPTSIDCPTYRDGPEDDDSLVVCVLCCSAPSAYCRRISEAQCQWLKRAMGKEPRWYPIHAIEYEDVKGSMWRVKPCCPKGRGLTHLVDLKTMTWKNSEVEGK